MNSPDRNVTLETRERLSEGCETMKRLLAALADSEGEVAEQVHAIRKLGKSLRGGFALFRLEKSAAREIQAIGRLLSSSRDAVSRFNTWNKLGWEGDPPLALAIRQLLEQQTHSAAQRPPAETIQWCLSRVEAAQAELGTELGEEIPVKLAKSLKKLERWAFKRCRALDHRSEEDFHEARKAVKALLGAVGFLPEGAVEIDPQFQELAELLGDENDLATLSLWLEHRGFTKRFAPALWKTLKAERRKLQKQVMAEVTKLSPA